MICGISVEQLPVELQHYEIKLRSYYGNPILDNIEPFDKAVEWIPLRVAYGKEMREMQVVFK